MLDVRRFAVASLLALSFVVATALPAKAQIDQRGGQPACYPECEVEVIIEPANVDGDTVHVSGQDVDVTFCGEAMLDSQSRLIKLRGTDVTDDFTYTSGGSSLCTYARKTLSEDEITLTTGSNSFYGYICDIYDNCSSKTVTYYYDPTAPPVVSTTPQNDAYHNTALLAAGGFETVLTYSTPAYISVDQARSATLVYRSSQAKALGVVYLDVSKELGSTTPDKFSLKLKDSSETFVTWLNTNSTEIYWDGGTDTYRIGGVFDASALATGAHTYTAVVRTHFSGETEETTKSITVLVVNEKDSYFARGWSLAGLQKLHFGADSSIAVTEGDGSLAYFKKLGANYTSPAGDFTTLEKSGTRYERTYPDGTIIHFGATGLQDTVEDRFGKKTAYSYSSGKLTKITDPAAKEITFTYNANGISQIKPHGTPWRYVDIVVDANKHLTSIDDPDDIKAMQVAYDTTARADSVVDRRGSVRHFAYDGFGFLQYDSLPEIEVDDSDVRPVIEYQHPAGLVGPAPGSSEGTSGNPASKITGSNVKPWVKDPKGSATYFTLDRFGAPTAIEEPRGRVTTMTRNTSSQVTRLITPATDTRVAPAADTVDFTWSSANLTKLESSATGQVVNYTYESTYNQVTLISGDVPKQWFYYTSGGLDSVRVATGADTVGTKYELDAHGRVEKVTDPEGHVTEAFFNGNPPYNLDSVYVDTVRVARHLRDGYGRDTAVVNALGETSRVVYDAAGRVSAAVNAASDTTTFAYDSVLVRTVTDALDQEYEVERNALGWVTVQFDPANEADSLSYDLIGNLRRVKTRVGDVITFTYDSLNVQTKQIVGSDTTHFDYSADGTWRSARNSASTDTLFFDAAGRPTMQKTCRGGTCYVLESYLREEGVRDSVKLTSPWTRSVRYVYDEALRLTHLIDVAGDTTIIGVNSDGLTAYIEMPSGDSIKFEPTRKHRGATVEYTDGTIDGYLGERVHFDSLSRIDELTRIGFTEDTIRYFEYDEVGRLTSYADTTGSQVTCYPVPGWGTYCYHSGTKEPVGDPTTYQYDEVGNPDGAGVTVSTGNRLTVFDGYTMVYDDAGRLERKYKTGFDHNYYWNALGQLDSVSTGALTVRYTYDGFGRRIKKTSSQGTVQYIWDGDDVFLELNGSDSLVAEYTYYPGIDRPHSMRRGGDVYYYGLSATGSVLGLFDESTAVNRYRYGPFGLSEGTDVEAVSNPLRFKARPWDDEVGLYYVRSRYYDPHTRRFISEDPIGLAGGINLYTHVGNDPANRRDPLGLKDPVELPPIEVEVSNDCGWENFWTPWVCNGSGDPLGWSNGPGGGGTYGKGGSEIGTSQEAPQEAPTKEGPSCSEATILFWVNAASDGFLVGGVVVAGVRLGLALGGRRLLLHGTLSPSSWGPVVGRQPVVATIAEMNTAVSAIPRNAGRVAAHDLSASTGINIASGVETTTRVNWRDYVPIVATLRARAVMNTACSN